MNKKEKQLTFSIIMPCYNSEAYVRDAVDSLRSQSYPNWELIAVNDGSRDDTLAILQDYAKNDDRIKIYSKENGGYATAINFGLDRVHGDYFLMMGSDDRLSSNLLEEIAKNITETVPDVVAFRAVKYINGIKTCIDALTDFDFIASLYNSTINEYAEKFPQHSEILFERDTAKCYRTELLGDLRYFGQYGYDADGIFSSLFVHKCHSFMSVPVDGYLWTLRGDSVSAKTNARIDKDRLSNWISYLHIVLMDSNFSPTEKEKTYLGMAHNLGVKLLSNEKHIDLATLKLIHSGRKAAITAARRFSVSSYLPRSIIRRIILIYMPIVWTGIFRLFTRKERKRALIP